MMCCVANMIYIEYEHTDFLPGSKLKRFLFLKLIILFQALFYYYCS